MARKELCQAVVLVNIWAFHVHWQTAHTTAEDPAEFFTMIFGGEAFVDWYSPFLLLLLRHMDNQKTNFRLVGLVKFHS